MTENEAKNNKGKGIVIEGELVEMIEAEISYELEPRLFSQMTRLLIREGIARRQERRQRKQESVESESEHRKAS